MNRGEREILDEIALREASLADARRERASGELSAIEAATIEAREEIALRRAYDELESSKGGTGRRSSVRTRRRWILLAGIACFLLAVIIFLFSSILLRQAGNSITGDVSLSPSQQVSRSLAEAEADLAIKKPALALSAYQQVLALQPKNVAALTETGWLEFSAGSKSTNPALVSLGIKDLRAAIANGPRSAAARLYYGIVALSTPGNKALAKREFEVFLDLRPSKGQLVVAEPFLKQLGLSTSKVNAP